MRAQEAITLRIGDIMQALDRVSREMMDTARATNAKVADLSSTADDLRFIIRRINGEGDPQDAGGAEDRSDRAVGRAA